jgi:ankyrin repeat protein
LYIEQEQTISNTTTLSTSLKLRRNISIKRKLVKNFPLIKKELENETIIKQTIERLIESIVNCNVLSVRHELENGTNPNTKFNNWSLLHYACSLIDPVYSGTDQHLELIKLLLEYGAEINSNDEDRWTPLHLACQLGVTRVIS